MAKSITYMIEELQMSMTDLKQNHSFIKTKSTSGRMKHALQNTIGSLEVVEKRIEKVDEIKRRTEVGIKSTITQTEDAVKKAEKMSMVLIKVQRNLNINGHKQSSHQCSNSTLNDQSHCETRNNTQDHINDSKSLMQTNTCMQPLQSKTEMFNENVDKINERRVKQPQALNKPSELLVHATEIKVLPEKTGKLINNSPLQNLSMSSSKNTSGSTSSIILSNNLKPNSEVEQADCSDLKENDRKRQSGNRNVTPNTVVTIKQKVRSIKSMDGLKSCLTLQEHDNRLCHQTGQKCFEGNRSSSFKEPDAHDKKDSPKPNIVPEHPVKRFTSQSSDKQNVAKIAETGFEQEKKVFPILEWYQRFATESELKVDLNNILNIGKISSTGHMYILLLDISESMRGDNFDLMVKTATEYIKGHKETNARYGLRDNVGLACFGDTTDLILPAMADYDGLLATLNTLKPAGPSPLAAGIVMALSAITRGLGITAINQDSFKAHIILMSDGVPTRVEALTEDDNVEENSMLSASPLLKNFQIDKELNFVIDDLCKRGFKIYCVPIGSENTDILTKIASRTNGRVVPCEQIHRMSRMTMTLFDASEIAKQLKSAADLNAEMVKNAIRSRKLEDPYDDIADHVLNLLDPRKTYPGFFKTPKSRSTPLGSRVRRGPQWKHNNEDSHLAGTVIGGGVNDESLIYVEWDNGTKQCYRFDEIRSIFEVIVVKEPRILVDDIIAVGCKVTRGKDWKYGDQDGGAGSVGTVLRVEANGKIVVNWDRKRLAIYKFGTEDTCEIQVCDQPLGTFKVSALPNVIDPSDAQTDIMSVSGHPIILPAPTMRSIKGTWQYQNINGGWASYDNDTNIKIEMAFSRKPNGKTIIEIGHIIYILNFSQMTQENQSNKSISAIQRIEHIYGDNEEHIVFED